MARAVEAVVEGGAGDWSRLREVYDLCRAEAAGGRRPERGGLAGWFDYEGNFRFAVVGSFVSARAHGDPAPREAPGGGGLRFAPSLGPGEWIRRVRRAQEYIAAGDIYQVNLTHRFAAAWRGDAACFYRRLCEASPAPYACHLRLGDTEVLSASPECFLEIRGRRILTRPIKGTRPRFADPAEDARAAEELTRSAKERAELVMITDLERNDLGQVCEYGTVRVAELCRLQSFAQVHHLVSTVEGTLRRDVTAFDAVRACFPGGSITGAPKKRAREIIEELEAAPRGLYTGSIGFFDWKGDATFSIAIRTLVLRGGEAAFGVGAGIVADSDPAREYEETLHKAAGLLAAAGSV